jgi:hypothetical protein
MRIFSENRGFTVLEAMASAFILAVGIMGVTAMLRTSTQNDLSSVASRTGDSVAQEVAERIKGEIATNALVLNLTNIRLNDNLIDPNFALVGVNNPAPNCPGGVNCVEQFGTYRGLNYIWRVQDRPDPGLVAPGSDEWRRTWRLSVIVGWGACPRADGNGCRDMGGGRFNLNSTQIVTFMVNPGS